MLGRPEVRGAGRWATSGGHALALALGLRGNARIKLDSCSSPARLEDSRRFRDSRSTTHDRARPSRASRASRASAQSHSHYSHSHTQGPDQ